MKKYLVPFVLSFLILGVFTAILYEHNHHRFSAERKPQNHLRFFEGLEWAWYDFKFRSLKPQVAPTVMVARIDDASLARYGSWPWSRSVYKEILRDLYSLGAEVVAFDAVFSEPEFQKEELEYSLSAKPNGFDKSIRDEFSLQEGQVKGVAEKLPLIGEALFAEGLLNTSTVLGYIWQKGASCRIEKNAPQNNDELRAIRGRGLIPLPDFVDSLGTLLNQSSTNRSFPILEDSDAATFYLQECPAANRSALAARVSHQGFFNSVPEFDGIFRRMPLVMGLNPRRITENLSPDDIAFLNPAWFEGATFFPSLALRSLMAYLDKTDESGIRTSTDFQVQLVRGSDQKLMIEGVQILRKNGQTVFLPTLEDGSVALRFFGSQDTIPYPIAEFSLATLQDHLFNPKFQAAYGLDPERPLKDRVVFVGPTALGVYDLRPNPVESDAAGVFMHATILARILDFMDKPGSVHLGVNFASFGFSLILLWGLGATLVVLMMFLQGLKGIWGFLLWVIILLGTDYYFFTQKFLALDTVTTIIALFLVAGVVNAYKYFTEVKERAFMKGAFEKYVSPDVVGSILKDPKKLNLGGEKRELSVLFSDIRGFTTISESMEAAQLAKFMNDYLSPMTDVILSKKGTIDKYMGDAIMAIFGAPVLYNDHAEHAVMAALEMLRQLDVLREGWKAAGLPDVNVGIGINTGDMSVGNMGSSRIFSYTVMGDAVNLGSRIEGINKEYGTRLIVSEFTRKYLGERFLCRELDRVKVKGKNLPVTIFEVRKENPSDEERQKAQTFEEALQLYYARRFEEAEKIFASLAGEDATSAIYVERCTLWKQEPPSQDWDGSWTMKTK